MAATVVVREHNGAAGAASDITSGTSRFAATDQVYAGSNFPLVVPTSGSNYSYWKHYRPHVTVAPTGLINNVKFYTDGATQSDASWDGLLLYGAKVASYDQATGDGTTGDEASANHTNTPTMTLASGMSSGTPLSFQGSVSAATGSLLASFLLLQMTVNNSAGPGTAALETMTWQYDET